MVIIKADIPEELDDKFREKIFNRYGMKKGSITKALTEAIEQWIEGTEQMPTDDVDIDIIQKDHPGKYLLVRDGEVVFSATTLDALWSMVPDDTGSYTLIPPRLKKPQKVRLGWRTSIQTN